MRLSRVQRVLKQRALRNQPLPYHYRPYGRSSSWESPVPLRALSQPSYPRLIPGPNLKRNLHQLLVRRSPRRKGSPQQGSRLAGPREEQQLRASRPILQLRSYPLVNPVQRPSRRSNPSVWQLPRGCLQRLARRCHRSLPGSSPGLNRPVSRALGRDLLREPQRSRCAEMENLTGPRCSHWTRVRENRSWFRRRSGHCPRTCGTSSANLHPDDRRQRQHHPGLDP